MLTNECGVSVSFDPQSGDPMPTVHKYTAIWDTGATGTVITQKIIDDCGLVATGMTRMHGVGGAISNVETFLVNIYLPNKVAIPEMRVCKGDLGGGADILIGMNVITLGDFAITNPGGDTQFSFRVPGHGDIDFVRETAKDNARRAAMNKKGPNNRGGQKHRRPKSQRRNKGKGKGKRKR